MDLKILNKSENLYWPCMLEMYVVPIKKYSTVLPYLIMFFEFIKLLGLDAESVMVSLSRMSIL